MSVGTSQKKRDIERQDKEARFNKKGRKYGSSKDNKERDNVERGEKRKQAKKGKMGGGGEFIGSGI